jgi:hypothetical protein
MRIKVVRKPMISELDGVNLEHFVPGGRHEAGTTLGALRLSTWPATSSAVTVHARRASIVSSREPTAR